LALAFEKEARVANGLGVLLFGGETPDTRPVAALDVVLQTGPRMMAREIHVARRHHKALVNERENAAGETWGKIRAEIERAVFFDLAREIDARILFIHRQLDVGIGLVVDEPDVEFRLVLFDEVVFQREGLARVREDDGIESAISRAREPVFVSIQRDSRK
jgi:hypothetical protein